MADCHRDADDTVVDESWPFFYHLHIKQALPQCLTVAVQYEVHLSMTNELDGFLPGDFSWPLVLEGELLCGNAAYFDSIELRSARPGRQLLQKSGNGSYAFSLQLRASCPASCKSAFASGTAPPFAIRIHAVSAVSAKNATVPISKFRIVPASPTPFFVDVKSNAPKSAASSPGSRRTLAPSSELHGFYHSFVLPDEVLEQKHPCRHLGVVVKEVCGYKIGMRIWDCAWYMVDYLSEIFQNKYVPHLNADFFKGKRILELGSGTGLVGLWLWRTLSQATHRSTKNTGNSALQPPQSAALSTADDLKSGVENLKVSSCGTGSGDVLDEEVVLSDLSDVMELLSTNVDLNKELQRCSMDPVATSSSAASSLGLRAVSYEWGKSSADELGGAFDIIIASDCLYNPEYFPQLIQVRIWRLTIVTNSSTCYHGVC